LTDGRQAGAALSNERAGAERAQPCVSKNYQGSGLEVTPDDEPRESARARGEDLERMAVLAMRQPNISFPATNRWRGSGFRGIGTRVYVALRGRPQP